MMVIWPVSDLQGVTSQKTVLFIVIAMKASNPKKYRNIYERHIVRNENASITVKTFFN
jgi:hypothetical protein